MGLTTTLELRWDASGAPVLNGTTGSFRNSIRDFLEDCGWSVVWEDAGAQKVVLRNSLAHGGSGCYVRVLDDGSFAGGARWAGIEVYESMSDIDTGTGLANSGYVMKSNLLDSSPRAFTAHGDQRTLYFTNTSITDTPGDPIGSGSGLGMNVICVGDYAPSIPGDPGVCGAVASPNTAGTAAISGLLFSNLPNGGGSTDTYRISRNSNLSAVPTRVACLNPARDAAGGGVLHGASGLLAGGVPNLEFVPAVMIAERYIRGRMRGLFIPLNESAGNTGGSPIGSVKTPVNTSAALSLASLAGNLYNTSSTVGSGGRVFVERLLSWDDV